MKNIPLWCARVRALAPLMTMLWVGSGALAVVGCSDKSDSDGDGLASTNYPELIVDPQSIVFASIPQGQSLTRALTLRNGGGSKLRIHDLTLSNGLDPAEFQATHDETPIDLEAGDEATVTITYTPQDPGLDSGHLLIESTDPSDQEIEIPISSIKAATQLRVTPDRLNFGQVPGGESLTLSVMLANVGTVPVTILQVGLDAEETSPDFTLGDEASTLPTLTQGDEIEYSVTYTPVGLNADTGMLRIKTDDPLAERVSIPLLGDEPSPEISTSPVTISFGAVDLGGDTQVEPLRIRNEGTAVLRVERIMLTPAPGETNEQFELHDIPDELPVLIEGGESLEVGVSYHPRVDGIHATGLTIDSNDDDENPLVVPIVGRVRLPCILVMPEAVEFGTVARGAEPIESARNRVQIVNCGDLPLEIQDIQIESDDPDFHWEPVVADLTVGAVLEPRISMQVLTWYVNTRLQPDEESTATLVVSNNTPDTPRVEVPLHVKGGGTPTCSLVLLPNRVDFGLLARGAARTRGLQVVNGGTGPCEVRGELVRNLVDFGIPGLQPEPFSLTLPLANRILAPGSFNDVEITYEPEVFSLVGDHGVYALDYWNPAEGVEEHLEAGLFGLSGESDIEVIPEQLDFGLVTAGECASREERVTVYNTGIVDLCISDVRLEGDTCAEFFIIERPRANDDGCIVVSRNAPANVILVYEPGNVGVDECRLVFESSDEETPELTVPLRGEGTRETAQVDEFIQTSGQMVDALFVVDNSGSMQEEQENLADNFANFIRGAEQFQNDYQIGVITTDMTDEAQAGRLQGNPRILQRVPDVEDLFRQVTEVGTSGAGEERGLAAARAALSNPLAFDTGVACADDQGCVAPDQCIGGFCGGYNRGFVRQGSVLELIFVSDEDDRSAATLNFFVDFFKNIKGFRNEALFHAHAIVGAEHGRAASCESDDGVADAGRRYVEVADRTHGTVHSICDGSFGASLRVIGEQAFGLPVQFFLSRPAMEQGMEVRINGEIRNVGWAYDEESNSVIFDDAAVPAPGAHITVSYESQCFQRR